MHIKVFLTAGTNNNINQNAFKITQWYSVTVKKEMKI